MGVWCPSHVIWCGLVWFFAGDAMWKYGHMRVRALLEREMFPAAMRAAPLVWQFSSLGSIGADWTNCGSASPKALTAQQARPYLSTSLPRIHHYQNLCCTSCCSCSTPARPSKRRTQGGLPSVPTNLASLCPGGIFCLEVLGVPPFCTYERQLAGLMRQSLPQAPDTFASLNLQHTG